jgi:hypothetical protein
MKHLQPHDTLIGKRVRVYRNLNKNCWSIQLNGLVVAHATTVKLKNVWFSVRRSGYERFQREGRKNVHAFVIGELVEINCPSFNKQAIEVVYNPRVSNLFHTVKNCFKGRKYYFHENDMLTHGYCTGKSVFVSYTPK